MKKLEVSEAQVAILRDFYEAKARPIWEKLNTIKKQWNEIEPMLIQLGILSNFTDETKKLPSELDSITIINPYEIKWSWLKKAEFILAGRGNMTSLQIIDILIKRFEPTLDQQKAMNSLPATLSVAARDGKILRHKNENGEYVYEVKK